MIACFILIIYRPRQLTLTIGVFAGSNWDVPNGDCYKIIDQAIERYEKNIQWFKLNMRVEF